MPTWACRTPVIEGFEPFNAPAPTEHVETARTHVIPFGTLKRGDVILWTGSLRDAALVIDAWRGDDGMARDVTCLSVCASEHAGVPLGHVSTFTLTWKADDRTNVYGAAAADPRALPPMPGHDADRVTLVTDACGCQHRTDAAGEAWTRPCSVHAPRG